MEEEGMMIMGKTLLITEMKVDSIPRFVAQTVGVSPAQF